MTPEKLEQRTDEKQRTKSSETIIARCRHCGKELQVPKDFSSLKPNREYAAGPNHDRFYKSPTGSLYCNRDRNDNNNRDGCFQLFTED